MGILYFITALIALALHIVLLVKLFQFGSVGLGILGVLCSPFAFVWGWMKCGDYGFQKLMVWLTIAIVLSSVFGGVWRSGRVRQNLPEQRAN